MVMEIIKPDQNFPLSFIQRRKTLNKYMPSSWDTIMQKSDELKNEIWYIIWHNTSEGPYATVTFMDAMTNMWRNDNANTSFSVQTKRNAR